MTNIAIASEKQQQQQQQQQQKQLSLSVLASSNFKEVNFNLWIDGMECAYVGATAPHQHLSIYYYSYYSTCVCNFFSKVAYLGLFLPHIASAFSSMAFLSGFFFGLAGLCFGGFLASSTFLLIHMATSTIYSL